MPFVPVANTAMAELRFTHFTQQIENTLYFEFPGVPDSGDLAGLAGVIGPWWIAEMKPILTSTITLDEVFMTDLSSATGAVHSYTTGLPSPGSVAVESMPGNVAACISLRTEKRGRANRGRNYIGGLSLDAVNTNVLQTTFTSACIAAYQQLLDDASAFGPQMVVVSRYSGSTIVNGKKVPTPRVAGLTEPVTSFTFSSMVVATMRMRLR